MIVVQPPTTLEDFQKVRGTILELMGNPWCDHGMLVSLMKRKKDTEEQIKILTKN